MKRVLPNVAYLAAFIATFASQVIAAGNQPVPVTHQHRNAFEALLTEASAGGAVDESQYKNAPSPICSTTASPATNVNTDCENTITAHNETTIEDGKARFAALRSGSR